MSSPISIEISPVGFTSHVGATLAITVYDRSKVPLSVTGIGTQIHGGTASNKCRLVLAPKTLQFSPERFTLRVGKPLRVHVKIIGGTKGEHIGALFAAHPIGRVNKHNNVHANGGVAAQIALSTGQLDCSGVPTPAPSGAPLGAILGASLGVAIGLLAVWAFLLRRRHAVAR